MSDQAAAPSSILGSLYSMGSSIATYASSQINSFLGWEDLDVVNPEAEGAAKGSVAKDAGLNQEERKQAWGTKQFQQYIGMDVTSLLSVPVWIMEPCTILQKAAEIMEYTELLDLADKCENPHERFAYVAAFSVTPFGASERPWKPFNPILGETFECDAGNGAKYVAEQVSHHPPVCAAHAENEHFVYDIVSAPTTRFLGNSLEVYPLGRTRITLRKSGEVYSLVPPNVMVHNIVIGRTWVDAFGPLMLTCPATGSKCVLEFTPCGWFGYGRHTYSGYVMDSDGKKHIKLSGKWNEYCDMVPCDLDGEPVPDVMPRRLWTCTDKPAGDYYSFTKFAHTLSSCEGLKRRSDRSCLYNGETMNAGKEKHRLEEMQRAEKRERESKGDKWTPRYFKAADDAELLPGELPHEKVPFYEWTGAYETNTSGSLSKQDIDGKGFNPWQYADIHDEL
eukprot:gene467-1873_t